MKAVLFDLDGTLLPMDQAVFTKCYFDTLASSMAQHGYEPEKLIKSVWAGTERMIMNDGTRTNEEVFWDKFSEIWGEKGRADKKLFDEFYKDSFGAIKASCGFDPDAADTVRRIREMGYEVIIATNPVFPKDANKQRLGWAGLDPDSFGYITSYENSHYSKPDPLYYSEIAQNIGLPAGECLMVGNDVTEDMAAAQAGMDVFLLTNCMINKRGADILSYRHGGYADLMDYITALTKG